VLANLIRESVDAPFGLIDGLDVLLEGDLLGCMVERRVGEPATMRRAPVGCASSA